MKKLKTIMTMMLIAVFVSTGLAFTNVKVKAASGQNIVSYARKFLGTPYVWGGTSPSGFDCSGFVQYVYKNCAGISLPRTTQAQINVGTPVSRSQLQPGDLVFPSTGHVGIYVGNGQMIHSPHTGDVVKISSVYAFYAGRRISGITSSPSSGGYTKDFIGSVQRDLRHCRCYSGVATGVIDQKTKEAIWKFRGIVGLPVNTTLDSSVVNALNQIVHKPRLSVNDKRAYAIRFVQWWIGSSPKDGLYSTKTKEEVRQWQIRAKIWSSSGADGIIRSKDWDAILAD
ncbi:NlpC/P60 family protein [Clostridium oceanicum]|uniref:NlpC/P60 domain-containing protein n=1 Tax=Clostridium oceanicum TaxID=1543 RepID=A0ABN1JBR1_9CLOT